MSLLLSTYTSHDHQQMLREAARAARTIAESEWELGAWLLAIDRTQAYKSSGFRSTLGFAIARLDLEPSKASNLLRIMKVLEGLPHLSEAFRTGQVGYAKIREITRVAKPDTEQSWLEYARDHTTDQVRQKVVCSPAAFERRLRVARSQADNLFTEKVLALRPIPQNRSDGSSALKACPSEQEALSCKNRGSTGVAPGAHQAQLSSSNAPCHALASPGDTSKVTLGSGQANSYPAAPPGGPLALSPGLPGAGPGSDESESHPDREGRDRVWSSASVPGPELATEDLFPLEEDGLPAPRRVRLVIELEAEDYAEWSATVERLSRQLGRRLGAREAMLELSRRHVAHTRGSSLKKNPVVVRLDQDGQGVIESDRGPLAISPESTRDYLNRASSLALGGPEASIVLLAPNPREKVPPSLVQALVARAGGCCEACSRRGVLHVHHIQPRSRGGTNSLQNLLLLCPSCHRRQHDRDFVPGSPWDRARERRRRNRKLRDRKQAQPTGSDSVV